MRHWYWRIANASLALTPSLCAPLGVSPSSQCASGSGAFNSVSTTLPHYSHYKYTCPSSLSSNHTHCFSIIYNITRFFPQIINMSFNYHHFFLFIPLSFFSFFSSSFFLMAANNLSPLCAYAMAHSLYIEEEDASPTGALGGRHHSQWRTKERR
jgi:hypothetical protein